MVELNNCPFCGNKMIKVSLYPSIMSQHTVICGMTTGGCGAATRPFVGLVEDADKAIEMWNQRVTNKKRTFIKGTGYKTCPCCGGEAIQDTYDSGDQLYHIICNSCGMTSGGYLEKKNVRAAWNRSDG